ncbi:uncharacterized protein [Coffea arabica]|uniref:Uncharacterized protein isoform X1 n=1 Tax=Coffea arabica TaxID=13443 RepID=A0A6P6T8H5_COFAR|nr:transmembrane protein 53 [Coffea arabica]
MEASVRILFNSSARHLPNSLFHLQKPLPLKPFSTLFPSPPPYYRHRPIPTPAVSFINPENHHSIIFSNAHIPHHPSTTPFGYSLTLNSPQFLLNSFFSTSAFFRIFSDQKANSFHWNYAPDGIHPRENGVVGDKGPIFAAVLLGWLGSKPKHLRRYVELYNSRGIHAVTFVASVKDVLSFDLGKNLEERISGLAVELASWLAQSEKDGRERFLIFHTFSNTGWLAYGAILDNLQSRPDLMEKIKGIIVDSGADANIDPKVWAAGFTAALLKKYSSSSYPSVEGVGRNQLESGVDTSKLREKEPLFVETLLLSAFEKLFSYLLNLNDVKQRLTDIISVLSKNQPSCPQLYLYSTADKVIPFTSVETFVDEQKRSGKNVWAFNFGASPHVDHYRTFPSVYTSELERFLNECLVTVTKF